MKVVDQRMVVVCAGNEVCPVCSPGTVMDIAGHKDPFIWMNNDEVHASCPNSFIIWFSYCNCNVIKLYYQHGSGLKKNNPAVFEHEGDKNAWK